MTLQQDIDIEAKIKEDHAIGRKWQRLAWHSQNEPVTESKNIDLVVNLLKDEFLNNMDYGEKILSYLRKGVVKYLTDYPAELFEELDPFIDDKERDDEKGHDDRERAKDIQASLR